MKKFNGTYYLLSQTKTVFIFILLLLMPVILFAQQDIALKERVRKEHPRLIFTTTDQERIEKLAVKDPLLQKLIESLFHQADQMLSQNTVEYKLEGIRLLRQSRNCLSKVMTLSMAYRLSRELKYAERAVKEMKAAAEFPDWNPSHFLDVAEMCAALSIGYDWLFDELTDDDKEIIKTALIEKGIKPGLQQYPKGFAKKINNWNFVCNGGLIMAAIIIADDEPEIAEEVIQKAFNSLPKALQNYAPDGAWFEGPGYWMYGTNYLAMLISSLETGLGTDFAFADYPGVSSSGDFFLRSIGPSGNFFNYADCRIRPRGSIPALFWLSQKFDIPFYAETERTMLETYIENLNSRNFGKYGDRFYHRFFALEIAWFDPRSSLKEQMPPLNSFFRGKTDIVYFRSSWDDNALFVGLKAGNGAVNHSHLDCGSFVFEALGERWIEDLGSDNYNLPGYFEYKPDGRRWNYFRISSLSHNVPTINGTNQVVNANTKVVAYFTSSQKSSAVLDLSNAYEDQAESVLRGIAMINREQLLIQDEIIGLNNNDKLRCALLTSADIELNGNKAEFKKGNETLLAEVIQPKSATFKIASTKPTYHPDEKPNKGTQLLTVTVPLKAGETTRVVILLTPKNKDRQSIATDFHKVIPLAKWKGYLKEK